MKHVPGCNKTDVFVKIVYDELIPDTETSSRSPAPALEQRSVMMATTIGEIHTHTHNHSVFTLLASVLFYISYKKICH